MRTSFDSRKLQAFIMGILPSILAVAAGLGFATIVIAVGGANPIEGIKVMFIGALGSSYRIGETLVSASPLLAAGLGVALAFKGGFWNIGSEGQILIGAITAVWVGIQGIPGPLHTSLTIMASFITGALWGLPPTILKVKYGLNEILTTLMMNYVAYWLTYYVILWPLDDPGAVAPQTYTVFNSTKLPKVIAGTRAHAGILFFFFLAILFFFILKHTSFGYEIRVVGENPAAARYAGIKIGKVVILTMIISGGLAGLAGMAEVCGLHYCVRADMTAGFGYLSIAVALLGSLHPIGVMLAALFLGGLRNGAGYMQRRLNISSYTVYILTGLVVSFILLSPLIRRFMIKRGWIEKA